MICCLPAAGLAPRTTRDPSAPMSPAPEQAATATSVPTAAPANKSLALMPTPSSRRDQSSRGCALETSEPTEEQRHGGDQIGAADDGPHDHPAHRLVVDRPVGRVPGVASECQPGSERRADPGREEESDDGHRDPGRSGAEHDPPEEDGGG